jgi:hypothetical protein
MRIGSHVRFRSEVFAAPYAPFYDAYRGETFEITAFRHARTHVALKCLSTPTLQVAGLVHPEELIELPLT